MEPSLPLEAQAQAGPLLRAAAEFAQIAPAAAGMAAQAVLGSLWSGCLLPESRSYLNWNGSPLQLLLSQRRDQATVRLLGDPLHHLTDPVVRYETGRRALRATLAFANASAMRAAAERTLELVVPQEPSTEGASPREFMFLGAALGAPGAALYLSPATRFGRWGEAGKWLRIICSKPDAAATLLARLATSCFLLGFGIEGALPSSLRIKLYWRMAERMSLYDFGVPLLLDSDVAGFVDRVLAGGSSPEALTFSAGFDLVTGALRDVKADVSWHDHTLDRGLALLDSQSEALGVQPARELLRRHDLGIACVGLGIDAAGRRRINTYLFQP